jgi:hypothetical protein
LTARPSNANNSQYYYLATRLQGPDVITLLALWLTLSGATLIYLASAQQRLRPRPLPALTRLVAWPLAAGGLACWWYDAGMGPGMTAALTTLMLTWIALPYLAWWRTATAETGE